jgi:D-serine deaminase-like pyridoxal phosphate-dependent protein
MNHATAEPASRQCRLTAAELAAVPTPALVVDLAVARANHARALALLEGSGATLRPHFKAHKCTGLAKLAHGTGAVSCQTSWEALALATAGFTDIMLTNQVVDPAALAELVAAAHRARISVLVDDPGHIDRLQAAAGRGGVALDVLIEVDVGMHRCGVAPGSDDLLALAAAVAAAPALRLIGIQAYEGHVTAIADPAERRRATAESAAAAKVAVDRLRAAGYAVPVVGGGATCTLPFIAGLGIWTDVQAGSYLLMDGVFGEFPDLAFDLALFAVTTVIHRSKGRIVVDAGLKQLGVDRGNPTWLADPGATLRLSDEHAKVMSAAALPAVGERTLFLPRHVDPTVNLHPVLWICDAGTVAAVDVDGRLRRRDLAAG